MSKVSGRPAWDMSFLAATVWLLTCTTALADNTVNIQGDGENQVNINTSTASNSVPVMTNQVPAFKGFMSHTQRVINPDKSIIEKIEALKPRLKASSGPKPNKTGPTTLAEAGEYLNNNVSMTSAPGAALEHEGWFYFSWGTSTHTEAGFDSGMAIRKGDTAIYVWEKEVPMKSKPSTENKAKRD